MITLTFPDGKQKQFKRGTTGQAVAESIGPRLAKDALAIQVNDAVIELNAPLEESGTFSVLTWKDAGGKKALWHTGAHVLAEAVRALYPEARNAIGPPIEQGFYQDFGGMKKAFSPDDFEKIEKKMREIIARNTEIVGKQVSTAEAKKLFSDNKYKCELVDEFSGEGKKIMAYKQGLFVDLCKGGHVSRTGKLKAIKLLKTSSAYWRGDQAKDSLQRIYGIAFPEEKMLREFLKQQGEAEARNHVKLGKELGLFAFSEYSPGSPLWLPKGTVLYNTLMSFMRAKLTELNYEEISTPLIMKKELWLTSGHWEHYQEHMYITQAEEQEYAIKPMNCPGSILVYKNTRRSHRELPLKLSEFGIVHRHELSGVLNGLFRVRKFTQDDAHIYCTPEQLEAQITELIALTKNVFSAFSFTEYAFELSTRPKKSMGADADWKKAEQALEKALATTKTKYAVNPWDGAFYGPKIDVHITDSLGRKWQCATIQVDFQMPQRFTLAYIGSDDQEHAPIMVHRAILGSLERFIGILIEHYAGKFPLWLSPEQAVIIPIADRHEAYALNVKRELARAGIRTRVDSRNETVAYKVRDAEQAHIPLILAVGDRDEKNKEISVRDRNGKTTAVRVPEFIEKTRKRIAEFA